MKFTITDDEAGYTTEVEADSAGDAAEQYARDTWDGFEELELTIIDENGVKYDATVEVESDPQFYVHVTKKKGK